MSDDLPVRLTAHPLQRVGAHALMALGGATSIDQLTSAVFDKAVEQMRAHVLDTSELEDAKAVGGFWLAASYLLWPNSKMNTTNRKRQSPEERREQIERWRTYGSSRLEVPCALCGRRAVDFYGKVDVPLGASVAHRNTTPPGHDGLALCVGCLASFHALPYGCVIGGGRAVALHSWDEEFLRRTVVRQVGRTRRLAMAGQSGLGSFPYAREVVAFRELRGYGHSLREGVDLYVFSNSNKEQVLDVWSLSQPLAEWLRKAMVDPRQRKGFAYLRRAHTTQKVPGSSGLARNAFQNPGRVLRQAVDFLVRLTMDKWAPPAETEVLVPVCRSFATEVLDVRERDAELIHELAGRIADLLAATTETGPLKSYQAAHREPRRLQEWLKRRAVTWTLTPGHSTAMITDAQWRLLFESDGQTRFHQDLLFISVLQSLAERGWRKDVVDDVDERAGLDDDLYEGE